MLVNTIKAAAQALGVKSEPEVIVSTHRGDTHYGGAYMATGGILENGRQIGLFKAEEKRGKTAVELLLNTPSGVKKACLRISAQLGELKSTREGLAYTEGMAAKNWWPTDASGRRFESRPLPEE
jgi:hypothetical protein